MATEDHDFEEINYFNFKGRKFRWNKEVPDLSEIIYRRIIWCFLMYAQELGSSTNAKPWKVYLRPHISSTTI
jgi:hypothetical protein